MPSVGRYDIRERIGTGGMATVHLARLRGSAGFSRAVAVKRLHPAYAADPAFAAMLLDEARLAARVRHPNVVPVLDVVAEANELFVVMEYVQGDSLASLVRSAGSRLAPAIAVSIIGGVLHGLHAAHVATDAHGQPLGIVHRDVSPQNVLVGIDGLPRVLDFGIAKAVARLQTTAEGQVKGKLGYMSPEQLEGGDVDARTDVFAAGAVLWELLTGERLFGGRETAEVVARVLMARVDPPSVRGAPTSAVLDDVVLRALARDPDARFASAIEMAEALERAFRAAPAREVGQWVEQVAGPKLLERVEMVASIERGEDAAPSSRDDVAKISSHAEGPVTQPTAVASVAARSELDVNVTRHRTRRTVAALAAIAACVASLGVWALVHGSPRANASVEPPSPGPSTSVTAIATSATSAPTATPMASVSVAESPPPTTATAVPVAPSRRAHPSTVRPPSRRETCDPPYYVNANGIHVPKPQCLD